MLKKKGKKLKYSAKTFLNYFCLKNTVHIDKEKKTTTKSDFLAES